MTRDTILIITSSDEFSIPPVVTAFEEMRQPYFRLDTDTILASQTVLNLALSDSNFGGEMRLQNGSAISTAHIRSVWFRRPRVPVAVGLFATTEEAEFAESEMSGALWSLYTNLDDVFWMNHPTPSRHVLEHNKLLQMKIAAECGLRVPDTIVSNSAGEIIEFCRDHGGAVATKILRKSVFNNTAIRSGGWIYTNIVTLDYLERNADNISSTALMVQEYVPKKVELRVTAVGKRLLTCAIHSQDSERTKVDWRRYDFERVEHEIFNLPEAVERKIMTFMNRCSLSFGAIDLIVTPDDDFVFLEVNPNGQYGWIERLTGLPISRAIAEALADPPSRE